MLFWFAADPREVVGSTPPECKTARIIIEGEHRGAMAQSEWTVTQVDMTEASRTQSRTEAEKGEKAEWTFPSQRSITWQG